MSPNSPIIQFADIEQAYECLRYWQHKLYLDDWIIKLIMIPASECPDTQGLNLSTVEMKSCVIKIVNIPKESADNHIVKYCQEATLVHELLHCFDLVQPINEGTYEQVSLCAYKHQQLEMLARSLIEIKYNLDRSFWRNT